MERVSLCPQCVACPEVVIEGDTLRIGEDENTVVLKKAEWTVRPARPAVTLAGRGAAGSGVHNALSSVAMRSRIRASVLLQF